MKTVEDDTACKTKTKVSYGSHHYQYSNHIIPIILSLSSVPLLDMKDAHMDMAKVDGNPPVQLKLTDKDGTAVKMETVDNNANETKTTIPDGHAVESTTSEKSSNDDAAKSDTATESSEAARLTGEDGTSTALEMKTVEDDTACKTKTKVSYGSLIKASAALAGRSSDSDATDSGTVTELNDAAASTDICTT